MLANQEYMRQNSQPQGKSSWCTMFLVKNTGQIYHIMSGKRNDYLYQNFFDEYNTRSFLVCSVLVWNGLGWDGMGWSGLCRSGLCPSETVVMVYDGLAWFSIIKNT